MSKYCSNRFLAVTVGLTALVGVSTSSQALTVDTTTYEFVGNCIDCAVAGSLSEYEVSASIVVQGYEAGGDFDDAHFFAFSYSGSNLINPFDISKAQFDGAVSKWADGRLENSSATPFSFAIFQNEALWTCTSLGHATLGDAC